MSAKRPAALTRGPSLCTPEAAAGARQSSSAHGVMVVLFYLHDGESPYNNLTYILILAPS